MRGAVIAAVLLSIVLVGVLSPRRALRSEAWGLLRCLWPSWRFFDSIVAAPELAFRTLEGEAAGPWQLALEPAPRGRFSLLLNARGNLMLAELTLVERLLEELDGKNRDEARSLISYQLVQRLVEARLVARSEAAATYQFSLFELDSDEPLFVSETHVITARVGHA